MLQAVLLSLGLLILTVAAPQVCAQAGPGAPSQQQANAVDPGSIEALKEMGAHLQSLKRFRVSTELTAERVLADGQKLQHTARAALDVVRPNKLRAVMRSASSQRDLFYDGKTVI